MGEDKGRAKGEDSQVGSGGGVMLAEGRHLHCLETTSTNLHLSNNQATKLPKVRQQDQIYQINQLIHQQVAAKGSQRSSNVPLSEAWSATTLGG